MNQQESNNEVEFSIVDGGSLDRGLTHAAIIPLKELPGQIMAILL